MGAPIITWRLVLCDNDGKYLSMLDGIAQDVEMAFVLNRTAMVTFNVPSWHPYVNIKMRDGDPYLAVGRRSLKAFRKVGTGAGGWDLKFAGRIWSLEDNGDGDEVRTQVTAFDPLKLLEKRLVRTQKGEYWVPSRWWRNADVLQPIPGDQLWHSGEGGGAKIIKNMIERSRKFAGMPPGGTSTGDEMSPVHIETGSYGIWTGDGTDGFYATTPMTFHTEPGSYIMPYIIQICNTGTVDLTVEYRDAFDKGVFMKLGAKGRVGTDKTGSVTLAYASPPFSAAEFVRTQDLDDVANFIHLWGKKATGQSGIASDATSKTDYLVLEVAENLPDITHKQALQFLADMRKKLQANPRDMVTVVPTPEGAPLPWTDYYLGDTITVVAADPADPYPVTREIVQGAQRVYGIKIKVDNDMGEVVDELIVSPQDAAGA